MTRWRAAWFGGMRLRILAVVILLLFFSSLGSVLLLRGALLQQLEDEIADSLERESEEFQLLSEGNDPRTGEPFDGDVEAIFDVYFAREIPDEGESLLSFVDGELYESARAVGAGDPEDLDSATAYWLALQDDERGTIDTPLGEARYVALRLEGAGGADGLFVVANFPAFERGEIQDAVLTQAFIALITLVLASAVGAALAGRVLRPLIELATTARSISDTDLTRRIPLRGRDEASLIAETFNDMLARLEEVFATQRRFLDDTSHELRTPLTVIRGQAEMLEIDDTAQARAETVHVVIDEVDRLSRMVDDLLLLARAEHPDFLRLGQIDVVELMGELHRKLTTLSPLSLHVDVPAAQTVRGDRQRLTQAVMQLVANAIEHAGESANIELGAVVAGHDLVLSVSDDGPGVPRDEAESIFDRSSQGAGASGRGAGLGLAIVRVIAEAHGGSARLADAQPGARFELMIPLTPVSAKITP